MQFSHKIVGLDKLNTTFAKLPKSTQNRALKPAMRKGMLVVREAASVNVQNIADKGYATGLLARSLRVYNLRKYRGMLRVAVMVKRGLVNVKKIVNGQPVRVGLYASVLEYGKRDQEPRSWIRKAAREKEKVVLNTVTSEAYRRIKDAVLEAKK